jgi:hypothetical protein
VPIRIANTLRNKLNWNRHMEIYDCVGMYETCVHHNIKLKLLDLYTMIFDYKQGKALFSKYIMTLVTEVVL